MDPHEILKVARTIKDRGNDSFKRGQLLQAQRDYTEVLAMLTEEITFTGDDQRKEKETLLLTAHLNLAQCALRLYDNARVIYHCNTALSMDSNNVKAHFRKARAFENRAEFAEALEGYRHVLTLEPHNETVQRQLSECQKKLNSQKAEEQMSNKMAGQAGQDIEDEDVEVVYEDSERDPQTRYKNCSKNPGHKNFIHLKDFKIELLPPDYRDQELFDHIKNYQSQVTVMLQVWPAKKFRSRCGRGTGRNKSGNPGPGRRVRPKRHGSGWLNYVDFHTEDDQPCPCQTCKNSGSPRKKWAEIRIETAGHVVCNDKEANNTECYFFYDAEGVDLNSCLKFSGAVIDGRNEVADTCSLNFISHDVELFQLQEIVRDHNLSQKRIREKYKSSGFVEPRGSLLEKFEELLQRFTEQMTELDLLMERVVAIFNGDPHIEFVKHRMGRKDKLEDDFIGKMLLDKREGGVKYQEWCEDLRYFQEHYYKEKKTLIEGITKFREQFDGERSLWAPIVSGRVHIACKTVEKPVMELKHLLDDNFPPPPPVEFNEDHRLTVIVSHPHGCSKKVTIGELTERTTKGSFSQLTYTTPTCPGSSGAMVFLLGQMECALVHPHSAYRTYNVKKASVQVLQFGTTRAGMWDVVRGPYTCLKSSGLKLLSHTLLSPAGQCTADVHFSSYIVWSTLDLSTLGFLTL